MAGWPEGLKALTSYRRKEDMSPDGHLSLFVEDDGDVIIEVVGSRVENNANFVQFCTGPGGGRSPRVKQALLDLANAIRLDNIETPQPGFTEAD